MVLIIAMAMAMAMSMAMILDYGYVYVRWSLLYVSSHLLFLISYISHIVHLTFLILYISPNRYNTYVEGFWGWLCWNKNSIKVSNKNAALNI